MIYSLYTVWYKATEEGISDISLGLQIINQAWGNIAWKKYHWTQINCKMASISSEENPSNFICPDFTRAASFKAEILQTSVSGTFSNSTFLHTFLIDFFRSIVTILSPTSFSMFFILEPVTELTFLKVILSRNLQSSFLPSAIEQTKFKNLLIKRILRCLHSERCS